MIGDHELASPFNVAVCSCPPGSFCSDGGDDLSCFRFQRKHYPHPSGPCVVLRGRRLVLCGLAVFRSDAPKGLQAQQEHMVQALSPRRSPAYTSKSELLPRSAWATSDTFAPPRFRVWAANGWPQRGFAHWASLTRPF